MNNKEIPFKYRNILEDLDFDLNLDNMVFKPNAGFDTDAVIIDNEYVALFSKNRNSDSIKKTLMLSDQIRDYVTLQLPSSVLRTDEVILSPMIKGFPLERHYINALTEKQKDGLADQIGNFISELQSVPESIIKKLELPDRCSIYTHEAICSRYIKMANRIVPNLNLHTAEWIREHCESYLDNNKIDAWDGVLCHGEMAPVHIHCDYENTEIIGILDFDQSYVGDPADDLFFMFWCYGQSFAERIIKKHNNLEKHFLRARFLMGFKMIEWFYKGITLDKHRWTGQLLSLPFDFTPITYAEFDKKNK